MRGEEKGRIKVGCGQRKIRSPRTSQTRPMDHNEDLWNSTPLNEIQRRRISGTGKKRKTSDTMTANVSTATRQDTLQGNADNPKGKSTRRCLSPTSDKSA